MRSQLGSALHRLEMYSTNSEGKRIQPSARGAGLMRVKETRSYYDDPNAGVEDIVAQKVGELAERVAQLTWSQRRCLELFEARGVEIDGILFPSELARAKLPPSRIVRTFREIPHSEEEAAYEAGWCLVSRSVDKKISTVVKNFPAHLTFSDISRIMGLTHQQVQTEIRTAYRILAAP